MSLQTHDWAGSAGDRWASNVDAYEVMLADAGEALLAQAALASGLSVAEIGCGGGKLSLAAAAQVGPDGDVVGIDISPPLIALCTRRAEAAGVFNVRFATADAATAAPEEAPFDRILSRFGIMFFEDPAAAFANLRALLKSGGRADFAVWASPAENVAVGALPAIAARYMDLPAADPYAPGPFSLCDPDHFAALLDDAGFFGIVFRKWHGVVYLGGKVDAAEAARFAMTSVLADLLAEQPQSVRDAIFADLQALFAPFDGPRGVAIPSAVWLVTATAS